MSSYGSRVSIIMIEQFLIDKDLLESENQNREQEIIIVDDNRSDTNSSTWSLNNKNKNSILS